MSNFYATEMLAQARTTEALAVAERGRLARIASCCRPSAVAAWAHALKTRVSAAVRPQREHACCV